MNVNRVIGCLLISLGMISCKDEDVNTVSSWNEDADGRMNEQDTIYAEITDYSNSRNKSAVFSDPLDDSLGPNLSITGGSGTIAFDSVQSTLLAGVVDGGDDGRVYIGTKKSDYITSKHTGFVAEVSVTINAGDNHAETAFIGVGEGFDSNHEGLGPSYDEPSGGNACAYFGVRDNHPRTTIVNDNALGQQGMNLKPIKGVTGAGTHRFRLTYDGTKLHLSAQINEEGPFIDHLSIDVSNNGFNETNSRIFFGGSNQATFNDFEIVNVTTKP